MTERLKLLAICTMAAAAAIVQIAGFAFASQPAQANADSYLSIDVSTTGNERNAIGAIDSCTSVEAGTEFTVDVVVRDVSDVVAYEFRLEFDHDVVSLNAVDYDHFLVSNDPDVTISPKLLDVENPNRVFIGAGEVRGNSDYGSGVLARLTMEAMEPGVSPLRITSQPAFRGPRMTDSLGGAIADTNGDGLWDAGISGAQVAVDESCDELEPIPTPPPATSPAPGGGNTGGGSGPGNGGDSGSANGGAGVAVIDDDSPDDSDDASSDDGTGPDGEDDPFSDDGDGSGEDGSSGEEPGTEGTGDDLDGDSNGPQTSQDGDDGLGTLPFVIGGLALAAIGVGATTLFVFRRRGAW